MAGVFGSNTGNDRKNDEKCVNHWLTLTLILFVDDPLYHDWMHPSVFFIFFHHTIWYGGFLKWGIPMVSILNHIHLKSRSQVPFFCGRKAAGAMARFSVHQQRQRPPLAAVTQTANDPLCQMLRCCCCRKWHLFRCVFPGHKTKHQLFLVWGVPNHIIMESEPLWSKPWLPKGCLEKG